jgi:hypothetical protein
VACDHDTVGILICLSKTNADAARNALEKCTILYKERNNLMIKSTAGPATETGPVKPNLELVKTKTEIQKMALPIVAQAKFLQVVDNNSFMLADTLRSQIKKAQKTIKDRLAVIIRPAYETLQALYTFQKELIDPLEEADVMITSRMKTYKTEESRRISEENRVFIEKQEALAREREEAERRLAEAKNKHVAAHAIKQMQKVEEKMEAVAPVTAPVAAISSGTRTVKKWRVTNLKELLKAIVSGEIPEDIIQINESAFNAYFRADDADKTAIKGWPGIKVYDDVLIVSKRGER